MSKFITKKYRAFTLIELLVAVSIFIIVVTIGLATVVTLTKTRNKAEPMQNVQQSDNLAIEMMVKAIKSASSISGTSGSQLTIGTKTFGFTPDGTSGYVWLSDSGFANQRITSTDVNVLSLNFIVSSDTSQSKGYVTIDMQVKSTWAPSGEQPITLHTIAISGL
jgi:type II secretory pathway pseudopilin PulG